MANGSTFFDNYIFVFRVFTTEKKSVIRINQYTSYSIFMRELVQQLFKR